MWVVRVTGVLVHPSPDGVRSRDATPPHASGPARTGPVGRAGGVEEGGDKLFTYAYIRGHEWRVIWWKASSSPWWRSGSRPWPTRTVWRSSRRICEWRELPRLRFGAQVGAKQ